MELRLGTRSILGVAAAACLLAAWGCATPRKTKKQLADEKAKAAAAKGAETDPAYVPGVDVTEAGIRGSEFAPAPDLGTIYFEYDSSALTNGNLEILKKNAEHLKEHKDLEVLAAGFCDERGTVEYNLALGQKRAKEVREYYIRLGVPGKSIATISYGKEQPACSEATEECWAKNRRGETRVRARTASNGHSPSRSAQ